MSLSYSLHLSEVQVMFLRWVQDGCPDGETHNVLMNAMQFVRIAKGFELSGYILHSYPDKPTWNLTAKGKALLALMDMEFPAGKGPSHE